jgi:hypothetical protein
MVLTFGKPNQEQLDSDRRAWRTYAAAALQAKLALLGSTITPSKEIVAEAASVADLMLEEERARRA